VGVVAGEQAGTVVTGCGRRLVTGRFRVPAVVPIRRVRLRVDPDGDCCGTVWVSLTAAEAVRLGQALLAQAQAIDAEA